VINVPSDSVAAALVDIQIHLVRMDGRLDGIDRRLDGIDVRLDGIEVRIKEVSAEVHILTRWKERALGVILASGVFAAMLAFAVNVAKMFVSSPS
jgi:hypothetical protein